jgi:hypothetical protein
MIQGCHLTSKMTHWSTLWRGSRLNLIGLTHDVAVYIISPAVELMMEKVNTGQNILFINKRAQQFTHSHYL